MQRSPLTLAQHVIVRSQRRRRQLRRQLRQDVARFHAALAACVAPDDASCDDGPTNTAIAAGWLATRARLGQLVTLRADVAEALHHVRVALAAPED